MLTCIMAGSGGETEGRVWFEVISGRGRKVAVMVDGAVAVAGAVAAIFQRRSWPIRTDQGFYQNNVCLAG